MSSVKVTCLYTITVLLIIYCSLQTAESRRRRSGRVGKPFINDPKCPLKPDLASKRKCLKKCHVDTDCKGRNKVCRCDDVCGWSCVKESKKCEDVKNIPHGHYEFKTLNLFGHKVRYWCDDGYILHGEEYRMCQGDGYWSGFPPSCQVYFPTRKCEEPQEIAHGSFEMIPHNSLGAGVRYKCNDGFMLRGQPERACRSDGHWSGIQPFCETDDRCKDPPQVPHATHSGLSDQVIFPLGTQLFYECQPGYKIDGFFKAMCVSDGKWVGPRMTCQPQRCSHPGDIIHGTREGSSFVYPKKVVYKCMKGYQIFGREFRVCQQNGEWSGTLPRCIPVKCPKLVKPTNGYKIGQAFIYGAEVSFNCLPGFKLVGSELRRCLHDGRWSGEEAACPVVDCGPPGHFPNGKIHYESQSHTTFGSSIQYKCFKSTMFEGESAYAKCQEDGKWSHPVPKCWSKCKLPPVANGTVQKISADGDWITHGQLVTYTCNRGFRKPPDIKPVCYNGSYTVPPVCEPESCSRRPSDILDGIVRYFASNHGDEAHYRCNTGYQLNDGEHQVAIVTCLYGNWTGEPPICQPKYCQYPGTIANGQILLVGKIGKYEYRYYVKKIGHNEQIEYHCNKTFKRLGPIGATCVAGEWSPKEKPTCEPGQHPKLQYLYRGRRSIDYVPGEPSTSVNNYDKGFCVVPKINNGKVKNFKVGTFIYHGQILRTVCNHGYQPSPSNKTSVCVDGKLNRKLSCLQRTNQI